jgi:hypothetical protein
MVRSGGDGFSWGMWIFPCTVVPTAPMVGEAARAVGWRWCSPLCGHVQWARGVLGHLGGGRGDALAGRDDAVFQIKQYQKKGLVEVWAVT